MKRILLAVGVPFLVCLNLFSQNIDSIPSAPGMVARSFNHTAFGQQYKSSPFQAEFSSRIPQEFHAHPEFGSIPYNSGLDSAVELIHERTEYVRKFVKAGTNGTVVYTQSGYYPLHYRDQNNNWISIDQRLFPQPNATDVYYAPNQISPTGINAANQYVWIENGTQQIRFNQNLELYYEDVNGSRTSLGRCNWTNKTVGEEGMYVTNAWPGIDMEVLVSNGSMKTNFKVQSPLSYGNGFLVFVDRMDFGQGNTLSFTSTANPQGLCMSGAVIADASGNSIFEIGKAVGYDQTNDLSIIQEFGYRYTNSSLELFVPTSWVTDANAAYPLVIDPLVTSSATTLQAAIGGSFHQSTGLFTSSCNYNMNVPTPANCTVTNMLWSFNYIAQAGAALCYGGVDFLVNACRSPAAPGSYWFCNNCMFAGTCTGTNISLWADVSSCIPAPQCLSYNIPTTLRFYARAVPNLNCVNTYIGANSNWVMTIEGQTVNQPAAPVSSNGTTICLGSFTTLTATGTHGVAPYAYLWSPGGQTTQSITVAPTTTTTYTCTITDACGVIAVNQVTITVNTANTLTPAPVFSISLSPASGNPCPVTATVTYTGANNYGGGAENYQWSFGGASSIAGGATSGSASAPPYGGPYTITYNTPGSYALSVTIIKSGQCAVTTQAITICGVLPVEVLNFDGSHLGNGTVELHWSSASEANNSHFVIERSYDGVTFEHVGNVPSKAPNGNSSQRLDYQIMDEAGVHHSVVYYRLKQFDFNGASEAVGNVSVQIDPSRGGVQVVPNPVNNVCTVTWNSVAHHSYRMTIVDATGAVVSERNYAGIDGSTRVDLDLSDLPTGFYLLRISGNAGEFFVSKLLIQKSK